MISRATRFFIYWRFSQNPLCFFFFCCEMEPYVLVFHYFFCLICGKKTHLNNISCHILICASRHCSSCFIRACISMSLEEKWIKMSMNMYLNVYFNTYQQLYFDLCFAYISVCPFRRSACSHYMCLLFQTLGHIYQRLLLAMEQT